MLLKNCKINIINWQCLESPGNAKEYIIINQNKHYKYISLSSNFSKKNFRSQNAAYSSAW